MPAPEARGAYRAHALLSPSANDRHAGGDTEDHCHCIQTSTKSYRVDHVRHGAVGAWVDLDSGVLGRGFCKRHGLDVYYDVSVVPGTTTPFVGLQLPYWSEVKDLVLRAAAAFPGVRSVR